ncbi:hypothetical protein V5O48_008226 [Marasmius crinis-equi]|uniref:Uncharacterized protein n=1 Tax=Marasmius crinis-equi TaxID=585013 RepID=A0ABR3FEP7_9AGAR
MTEVQPFASYFASPSSPFDFSGLETLRLVHPRDGGSKSLLQAVGREVKHLALDDLKDSGLDLGVNVPNLRILLLGVRHTATHSPVSWIQSLFSGGSSNIQTVTLQADFYSPGVEEDEGALARFLAPWQAVDELFADVSAFPCLPNVTISLLKGSTVGVGTLRGRFPMLLKHGKLRVTKSREVRPSVNSWR